jgi:hypothetical protein
LARVHFRVAETTQDCDLLCHARDFGLLLEELARAEVDDTVCRYRGNLSAPLDDRWHRGGWTSHFTWGRGPNAVTLDVFGRALRGSSPWQNELSGLYISPHIVAEMKRTNRDKDWPSITALGVRLIEAGDPRGWLHIFDEGELREIERRFHRREFGEELTRVNLDMSEADRIAYVSWMCATARQNGIDLRARSVHAWMDRLEEETVKEEPGP